MAEILGNASEVFSAAPQSPAPDGAQSIRRAANILRAVGSFGRSGAPVRKIALLSGLHKATAHRILCVLASEGLLEQDATTRNYRLGAEISALTASMGPQFDLRLIGKSALDNLSELTHDTIQLGVRTYYDGLCWTYEKAVRLSSSFASGQTNAGRSVSAHSQLRCLPSCPIRKSTSSSKRTQNTF